MDRLFRWFLGYIDVRLHGRQINRFINLCSRNGIHLWNISHDIEHFIRVCFRLKDFYLLKPFLRKTKTKLRILGRHGFPFWCHRHPHLKWFPVLLLVIICLLIYSRTFIWEIQIHGAEKVSEYELLKVLEEHEITVGKKSSHLDYSKIEYEIRNRFADIGWVSVYMLNTKLCIDIRESLYGEFEDNISDGQRYDLIANKDAYIHTMVTRYGTAIVGPGTFVKKGDLLVAGIYQVLDDSGLVKLTPKTRAESYILGDVVYEFYFPITELEIMALKISDHYNDVALFRMGNDKLKFYIDELEKNDVLILDQMLKIEKKEKSIVVHGIVYAREQIGENILMEE